MIRRRIISLNFIVVGLFVRIKGFKEVTPDDLDEDGTAEHPV